MSSSYSERYIQSNIEAGSVFYFLEKSIDSPKPHRFIVLNINPQTDILIVLVCASTQFERFRRLRKNCPNETLVEITPIQYSGLTEKSIIDCNKVFPKQIDEITLLLSKKKLQVLPRMDLRLVRKLRNGVLMSPLVAREIKTLLRD